MPKTKCPFGCTAVSTTHRGQTIAEALAKHIRLAHEGDRPPTHQVDADSDDPEPTTINHVLARLGSAFRVPEEQPDMPTLNDNFYADMERLPFFVYGTLRPGFGNDRLWQGRAAAYFDGEATAPGWGLVDRGIPYAVPAVGMAAVGCLVMPFDDEYPSVARSLDGLEGYPVHYDRVAIDAHMPSGSPIRAWIYTPADTTRFTGERLVEDWGASHLGRLHAYSSAPTASPVPSRPPVVDPDPDPDTLELPVDELTDKQMIRHAIAGGEVRLVDGRVAMLVSWTPARKTGPCKVRFGPSYKRVRRDDIAAALVKVEGRVRS